MEFERKSCGKVLLLESTPNSIAQISRTAPSTALTPENQSYYGRYMAGDPVLFVRQGDLLFHPLTQLQRDRHFAPGWPWGQLNVSVTLNSFIPIDGNVKASNSAEGNASERHGHNPSSSRIEHQQFY